MRVNRGEKMHKTPYLQKGTKETKKKQEAGERMVETGREKEAKTG